MARRNQKERQKKVEDLEDISADSEPDHDLDASEIKKVSSGRKETEPEDEATTNSDEDQPEKEVKKKGSDSTEKKRRKRKETEPEDEATTNSEEDQPEKEVKKKGSDSTEKKQRKRKETEPEDEASTNSEEDQPEKEVKKKVSASDSSEKKRRKRKGEAHHPPTIDMVLEALMYLDNKKGVSIPAMKDYIMTQNTIRPENLKHLLRKALVKLLGKESIIRPKGEENKSVLLGRYKIAPKKDVKPEKPRERPASLRKLVGEGGKIKKTKKKKRKRSGYY